MSSSDLAPFLVADEVIDAKHPDVVMQARMLAAGSVDPETVTRRCFEWVRDTVKHSRDYRLQPVPCSASETLRAGSGFCFAKSHLLAALLRANGIPAGFCYQRLSRDGRGAPFTLHGLNAVFLPGFGWYRLDARGNRADIRAEFAPPAERLAFDAAAPGEALLPGIRDKPLAEVVAALRAFATADALWEHLPDASVTLLS